jgi:rhodanese-related sulfurtransferase
MFNLKQVLFLLVFLPMVSCGQEKSDLEKKVNELIGGTVPITTVSELADWKNVQLLDARELEEFQVSHLPNAKYVGDKKFNLKTVSDIPKTDTIVVYCSVGYRSEKIGEKLEAAGYQHVYNLFGGIFAWKNAGKTVVDTTNLPTEKVHTYNKSWGLFLLEGEKVY